MRLLGGILSLFVLFIVTIYILICYNQDMIREMAISQIKARIKGEVTLASITPAFFKTFPDIAVNLHKLTIRDSLWEHHQNEFLKAKNIYVHIRWISLLKGKPEVSKVRIEDGYIYLYTDSLGYRNLNLTEDVDAEKGNSSTPAFTIRRTRLIMENDQLNSHHDIDVKYLHGVAIKKDSTTVLDISIRSTVHGIGFNLEKGSYLKNKSLQGTLLLTYFPQERMELTEVKLNIQRHPFNLRGAIYFDTDTMSYALGIQTDQIHYKDAVSLLTESLQQNFDSISIAEPFYVEATVIGKMARKVVPAISTRYIVKNTTMETPIGQLNNCSYNGIFTNQVDCQTLPGDPNSRFTFTQMHVDWSDITITSCQFEITNLLHPFLVCDLQSTIELTKLNNLGKSSTMQFLKGTGRLDVIYQGALTKKDTLLPILNGKFLLQDAAVKYVPRNLDFINCSGEIAFRNQDLILTQLLATIGRTQLTMKGEILNLMAMLDLSPDQLTMDWIISTPALHLEDFISFVGEPIKTVPSNTGKKTRISSVSENIDRMLSDGTVKLKLTAGNLQYKKFYATGVSAGVLVTGNKLLLQHTRLNHAGGTVTVVGGLTNNRQGNVLDVKTTIKNVNIPDLFKAFDNFGQDAITTENMKGVISANASLGLVLTDKAEIKENSMKGSIDFSIKKGQLINFEPLVTITKTTLKNRDFSKVEFAELQNRFFVIGTAFHIPKMEILANVVVLFVEGVYDTKLGTDMSIQIPLSNLSREENEIDHKTGKVGMNVRLRAKTGDDGKLNISWDPLNKASKARKAILEKDTMSVPPKN